MLLNYPLEKGVSKQLLRLPAPLSLPSRLVSNAKLQKKLSSYKNKIRASIESVMEPFQTELSASIPNGAKCNI